METTWGRTTRGEYEMCGSEQGGEKDNDASTHCIQRVTKESLEREGRRCSDVLREQTNNVKSVSDKFFNVGNTQKRSTKIITLPSLSIFKKYFS